MQSYSFGVAGGLLALAIVSGFAEHRRRRRKRVNMDDVGWVPWTTIQMAALFAAFIAGVLALHAGS